MESCLVGIHNRSLISRNGFPFGKRLLSTGSGPTRKGQRHRNWQTLTNIPFAAMLQIKPIPKPQIVEMKKRIVPIT